jgi:hypothetical protein
MAIAAVSIKPGDRASVLIANRQAKMAQSARAYVRGNTLHFYEWLKKHSSKTILMATTLGMPKIVRLLNSNLKEELNAAKKITAAGVPIMAQSAREPEEPKSSKTGKEKYSAKRSKEDEAKAAPDLAPSA